MYYVYILSSRRDGVLYIGFTDDLIRRMYEHKNKVYDSFTKKYNVDKLMYFETYKYCEDAELHEKRLKKWNRKWKTDLIVQKNPAWLDLSKHFPEYADRFWTFEALFAGNFESKSILEN